MKKTFLLFIICGFMIAALTTHAQSTFNLATGTGTGSGWSWSSNLLTVNNGANITITGSVGEIGIGATTQQRRIAVAANANVNITLNNVTVQALADNLSPLLLNSGSTVNLTIVGENRLTAGANRPGIQTTGATLIINGTGTLRATGDDGGAGIGGAGGTNATSNGSAGGAGGAGGNVTINGGTIIATGGPGSHVTHVQPVLITTYLGGTGAGIGGGGGGYGRGSANSGKGGDCGAITINGGRITASGGGRGIGGGNGGRGGYDGTNSPSGTGNGGNGGNSGNISINDGMVMTGVVGSSGIVANPTTGAFSGGSIGGGSGGMSISTSTSSLNGSSGLEGTLNMDNKCIIFTSGVPNEGSRTGGLLVMGNNINSVNTYWYGGPEFSLGQNVTIPKNYTLTVHAGRTLIIPDETTLTIADGAWVINNGDAKLCGGQVEILNNTPEAWTGNELGFCSEETLDNLMLAYVGCGKLSVKWDVVPTMLLGAGVGDVEIVMSGAFAGTFEAPYAAGTAGLEIEIPETLWVGAAAPDRKTFTVNATDSIELNMAYQCVSASNIKLSENRSFTVDWQVDDGYVCNNWYYQVVVKQGSITPYRSANISALQSGSAKIPFPDGFMPAEQMQITLELFDGSGNLKRENLISHQFSFVELGDCHQFGDIPDQIVWHNGDGAVGFCVLTDELEAESVTLSYTIDFPPTGIISFNPATGAFVYFPDLADVRDFTVALTADMGEGKIATQDVRFRIMAVTPPEFAAFGVEPNKPMPPSGDKYTIISKIEGGNKQFNNAIRDVISYSISGKELVFDGSGKLNNLSGRTDIYELNLYAEKIIIKEPLHFKQTNVTIYAKELIFEGDGSINTSPEMWSQPRIDDNGSHGENAGNITLYIKSFKQTAPQTRFILIGGKGQDTEGLNRSPGNGGNGGTLTSTLNVKFFSSLVCGSSGIQYPLPNNGQFIGVGKRGNPGSFELYDGAFTWLHTNYVSAVVKHAKDAYQNLYTGFVFNIFSEYLQYIEEMKASEEWAQMEEDAEVVMAFNSIENEMKTMLFRINQNLDFFGNAIGWVPMLSFEVNQMAFKDEIEKALRVMYLNYWLTHKANDGYDREQGYRNALDFVREELKYNQVSITKLARDIENLQIDMADLDRDIIASTNRIEHKYTELVAKAEKIVKDAEERKKKKSFWQKVSGVLKVVAKVAPVLDFIAPGVGTTISTSATTANSALTMATNASNIYDYANAFDGFLDAASPVIGGGFGSVAAALKDLETTVITTVSTVTSPIFEAYNEIRGTVDPLIESVQSLRNTFAKSTTPNSQVQEQLNKLLAESKEFNDLIEEQRKLTNRKLEVMSNLEATINRFTTTSIEAQKGIATADGLNRSIYDHSSTRDLRAMQYLDEMDRRARERLLEYHYYLAKSYEYRLLKPYTAELDLTSIWNNFSTIPVTLNQILTSDQFRDIVLPAYEFILSNITQDILRDFNLDGKQELTIPVRFQLTPNELADLNSGKDINLNLFERAGISLDEENVRIVGFSVYRMTVAPLEGSPSLARFDLQVEHSGTSMLRRNGQVYWFDHRSNQNSNPFFWRFRHDVINNITNAFAPSFASTSLLLSLLPQANKNDIMIFSRPGVMADMRISKINTPENIIMNIEELWFELQYDFMDRPNANRNLDVYTADVDGKNRTLTPYIQVSSAKPEVNGRSDGRSPMYRAYPSSTSVTLTAPQEYGRYLFVNWTDRFGAEVTTNLSATKSLNTDQVLIANYKQRVPILQTVDTVFVSSDSSSTTILLENIGSYEMEWSAVSDSPWLQITGDSEGLNDGHITLDYEANPLPVYRIGSITITLEDTGESKTVFVKQEPMDVFVPVTDIANVPTSAIAGIPLVLAGTVLPVDAANKTIVWSVQSAGTTGATISEITLNTTAAGTVTVRATIANGSSETSDYTQDFNIAVTLAQLSGSVAIVGSAIFGETLTANTTSLSSVPLISLGTFTYQWKRNGVNMGGNSATYTLVQADIESAITVTVTAANCSGSISSNPTATVIKANQTAPAAPELLSRTAGSITLVTIANCEYNMNNGAWQASTTFSGLTPNTTYNFAARKAETVTHLPSPESSVAQFTTNTNGMRWSNPTGIYSGNMTIMGVVVLDGVELRSDLLEVGAFYGEECRGTRMTEYVADFNKYLCFLMVYGETNVPLTFKVYDHETDTEYDANNTITYNTNDIIGNPVNAYEFLINTTQNIPLTTGWNWVSTNRISTTPSLLDQMKSSLSGVGEQIKGNSAFIQLYGTVWVGSLSSISEKEMYLVKMKADHPLTLFGKPADPANTPIPVSFGWNWISYIPSFPATVGYALSSVNAKTGDMIKNDAGFSTFYGTSWYGTLPNMQSGGGYQYNSTNATPKTFYYPSVAAKSTITTYQPPFELKTAPQKGLYPGNMTVTAIVHKDNEALFGDGIEIEAFCGKECRGAAFMRYEEDFDCYLCYLMIYGESDEMITLKVYDHVTGKEYTAVNQPFPFIQNEIKGNLLSPYIVDLSVVGIDENMGEQISIYPNPAKDHLYINHPWTSIDLVEIVDVYGRVITRENNFSKNSINIKDIASGVYMLRVTNNNKMTVIKFVKD